MIPRCIDWLTPLLSPVAELRSGKRMWENLPPNASISSWTGHACIQLLCPSPRNWNSFQPCAGEIIW
ncbi:hypothetical protein K438DRAFT_1866835 [Mycena galopus ATCC 62051]|nr:hypothetical protein K438DRAFT_1866835 [Mycena galopus ATCC 62051]